jgi:molybdopterin converting factor small subunit
MHVIVRGRSLKKIVDACDTLRRLDGGSFPMHIDVVFYGGLKERLGTRTASIELDDSARVDDALDALIDQYPQLEGRLERIALAVGDEIVDRHFELADNDELCLLPPVSGGR